MFLPLSTSDDLTLWSDTLWNILGDKPEPPSLYLLRTSVLFEEHDEAYQRTVSLPDLRNHEVHAIYRCFRSEEHRQQGWEFTMGVYLS